MKKDKFFRKMLQEQGKSHRAYNDDNMLNGNKQRMHTDNISLMRKPRTSKK
jgi:hypothetical protein